MWDLATIVEMNKEAGEAARANNIYPYRLNDPGVIAEFPPFPFPNIGDDEEHWDEKMEKIDRLFCDSTGLGSNTEPALTISQLKEKLVKLVEEHGTIHVAIVEHGQFQLYIGVWK